MWRKEKEVPRRSNKAPTRLEDQEYYLVQFVDDGILEIVTESDLLTREDGRKEARYGDTRYLCMIVFNSDDKDEVMRRKATMQKLQNSKPAKNGQKKNARNEKDKENKEQEGEQCSTKKAAKPTKHGQKKNARNEKEKEDKEQEGDKCSTKKQASKEEVARKKAEREKKKAEIEKAKEVKATEKAAKEKERAALMERDNRVLAEMTSFASSLSGHRQSNEPPSPGEQSETDFFEEDLDVDSFDGTDIVSECSTMYLNNAGTPLNPTVITPESNTNHCDPTGNNLVNSTPLLLSASLHRQDSNSSHRQPFQPRQLLAQLNKSSNFQTSRSTVGGKRPRSWTATQKQQVSAPRPAVGGKRPRSSIHLLSEDAGACEKCKEYLQVIERQEAEIAQLKAQVNGRYEELPRPGKVPQFIAARFKMVELSKGRGVYLYEDNITAAKGKNSPTSAACFLLSCFFKNEKLVGKNLTGANSKEALDADIVTSILDFAVKEGGKEAVIKQALRNKMSSITTRASGWTPSRKVQVTL